MTGPTFDGKRWAWIVMEAVTIGFVFAAMIAAVLSP